MSVPALGVISYGGINLSDAYATSQLQVETVYDPTGRHIDHLRAVVTVSSMVLVQQIAGPAGNLNNIDYLQKWLTEPGREFVYAGQGPRDLYINTQNPDTGKTVYDLDFGPKPKLLKFRRVGGQMAYEITWQVETRFLEGFSGEDVPFGRFRYMTYTVGFGSDESGNQRRTISGEVCITLNRQSVAAGNPAPIPQEDWRRLPQALNTVEMDYWRRKISVPLLPGFTRTQEWNVGAAKNTMVFTITDQQLPAHPDFPYPPGILSIDVEHTFSTKSQSELVGNFIYGSHTLSGSASYARGYTAADAIRRLYMVFRTRMIQVRSANLYTALLEVTLKESLFARTVSMTVAFVQIIDIRQQADGLIQQGARPGSPAAGIPRLDTVFSGNWFRSTGIGQDVFTHPAYIPDSPGLPRLAQWQDHSASMYGADGWLDNVPPGRGPHGNIGHVDLRSNSRSNERLLDARVDLSAAEISFDQRADDFIAEQSLSDITSEEEIPPTASYLRYSLTNRVITEAGISEVCPMLEDSPLSEQSNEMVELERAKAAARAMRDQELENANPQSQFIPKKPPPDPNRSIRAYVSRTHGGSWRLRIYFSAARVEYPVEIPQLDEVIIAGDGRDGTVERRFFASEQFVMADSDFSRNVTGQRIDGRPVHVGSGAITFIPLDPELRPEQLVGFSVSLSRTIGSGTTTGDDPATD